MHRQFVESSMLRTVGYDREKKVLELEFHHGGIYQYLGVDEKTWRELVDSDSLGHYFIDHIKGQYEDHRVQ